MKTEYRRFAPLGLYLSLIAVIVSAGLYIVQREFNLPLQISLALIVVGLAFYAILDPGHVRESLTGRQARYGSNTLVMALAFIGILVVINFLVYKYPKRWDLTEDQQHTLTPETTDTLKALPEPVTAVGFFTRNYPTDYARSQLQDFKNSSNGKFDFKFVDPDADPVSAQSAKITQDGTVVLQMNGRQEQVTSLTEQEMTSALIRLSNPGPRSVYFLTGHGERDPQGSGDLAFSRAKQALETKNYTVNVLNLLATPTIPEDALAVIIAGPQKPVSENEVQLLQEFVNKGGALVVMEEPLAVTQFGDAPDPLAGYLSQNWGIILGNDIVIDTTADPPTVAVANGFETHAIVTQKLKTLIPIFPTARSVQIGDGESTAGTVALIKTANQSWGETNIADLQNNKAQYDAGQDVIGPVTVVATGENTENQSNVVVIGDSDFATDRFFDQYGNADLFVNSVDWAAGQQGLINLTPKQSTQRMILPPQKYMINLIFFGSVFVLPGAVLFAGIFVWIQRRRRG